MDGTLGHIGNEHQYNVFVLFPDAFRRWHTAQQRHIHIQHDDVKPGLIRHGNGGAVCKRHHLHRQVIFLRILPYIAAKLFPHSQLIIHHRDPQHMLSSFVNCSAFIIGDTAAFCK